MPNTSTNFENSKHRRIYQGARGGFFTRHAKKSGNGDEKVYNPVARFRKVGADGAVSALTNANRNAVPNKIRGKVTRKKNTRQGNNNLGYKNLVRRMETQSNNNTPKPKPARKRRGSNKNLGYRNLMRRVKAQRDN